LLFNIAPADQADHNQKLTADVFAELNAADPGGVRYATFRATTTVISAEPATPNSPRTWTEFRLNNLVAATVVDPAWTMSLIEVDEILWFDPAVDDADVLPPVGGTIGVVNPIRHLGCAPDPGDRFVVQLSARIDGSSEAGPVFRIDPDGSLTVIGGPDPELDQRVFEASTVGGVLDPEAIVALAADLATIDRSTVQLRVEAGQPLDRIDGSTSGPVDAAMTKNITVLMERSQRPNW